MYFFDILLIFGKILIHDDSHNLTEIPLLVFSPFIPNKDQQLSDSFLHFIIGNLYL